VVVSTQQQTDADFVKRRHFLIFRPKTKVNRKTSRFNSISSKSYFP